MVGTDGGTAEAGGTSPPAEMGVVPSVISSTSPLSPKHLTKRSFSIRAVDKGGILDNPQEHDPAGQGRRSGGQDQGEGMRMEAY